MSCCNCQLFDLDCLRRNAGIPRYVKNDSEALQQAYNDVVSLELQIKLGDCFAYFCQIKQQIDDLIITPPAWWDVLINQRLLNFASKALRYYFLVAGLANGNNEATTTADIQQENYKIATAALYKQTVVLWEEVKKWLDENAVANNINCWKSETCKKDPLYKFNLLFTTNNPPKVY